MAPLPRPGLGCMRLSTAAERDEARAVATLEAAFAAGARVFDTARAYALHDDELGHNERLLARTLAGAPEPWVVITKCGMRRPGGRWVPDGRRAAILADAEASAESLGRPADFLLLHAPDPRTGIGTSARALAAVKERGLARAVGLSNATVGQLDEAARVVDIDAVQVAFSRADGTAVKAGVLDWARDRAIPFFAHSPLGGPPKRARVLKDAALVAEARRLGTTPGVLALAWLLDLDERIVPLVGSTRPDTAAALAGLTHARALLDDDARRALDAGHPAPLARTRRADRRPPDEASGDVVLIMGLMGAGKSELARSLEREGYLRLNRDEAGGRLSDLLPRLDEALRTGRRRVVLDNTYATRALRSDVVEAAWAGKAPVRCLWVRTATDDALVNAAGRLLDRYGHLPMPEELATLGKTDPHAFDPRAVYRAERELEPPSVDEGFVRVDEVVFERRRAPGGRPAVLLEADGGLLDERGTVLDEAAGGLRRLVDEQHAGIGIIAWRPGASAAAAEEELRGEVARALTEAGLADVAGSVVVGVCTHPAGPPRCWCRKPLPGLALSLLRHLDADPARSILIGPSPADRTLARRLGLSSTWPWEAPES